MRDELEIDGNRHKYRARVECFSYTRNHYKKETILLKNVTQVDNDQEVADHLWFTKGDAFNGAKIGDIIEFEARPSAYLKGAYGSKRMDVKLNNPTRLVVVKAAEIIEPISPSCPPKISPAGYLKGVKVK